MAEHPGPLLITGASRGIGEATARLFAQRGHRVALVARRVAAIESLADEIGGLAIPCDVTDQVAVRQAVRKCATEFGGIGIIINNAGTGTDWTRTIGMLTYEQGVTPFRDTTCRLSATFLP